MSLPPSVTLCISSSHLTYFFCLTQANRNLILFSYLHPAVVTSSSFPFPHSKTLWLSRYLNTTVIATFGFHFSYFPEFSAATSQPSLLLASTIDTTLTASPNPTTTTVNMRSKFKDEHPFEKRKAEAERIRQKYADRIPVCIFAIDISPSFRP